TDTATKRKVFVYDVPKCASAEELLHKLPGDDGVPLELGEEANALYLRKMASQIRPLHEQLLAGGQGFAVTAEPLEADLFYIPAFFSVLFWMGTLEAMQCTAETFAALRGQPHFRRHGGRDHMVLFGVEFAFYRDTEPAFQLTSYEPSAKNWLVLTVACPLPCGQQPDSWSVRDRFVLIPFASRLRNAGRLGLLAP
ncbi:unnamed protein product, partial [Symbiodinium natans]